MGRQITLVVIVMALGHLLSGCSHEDSQTWDLRCPPDDLVERFALEGSPTLCDGCDAHCFFTHDLPDDGDLEEGDRISGRGVTYDHIVGGIIIDGDGGEGASPYAWVASNSSLSDTVTKVHLGSSTAEGVYRVGLKSNGLGNNQPSQIAVDIDGHAYVASRCFDCQGTVAKISALPNQCNDLNLNKAIDTSKGLGDIRGWWSDADQDECLLWQVPVGDIDGRPQPIVIDGRGRIWVGLHNEQRYVVLDALDGAELGGVAVDHLPSTAALTSEGLLWSLDVNRELGLQPIDTDIDTPAGAEVGALVSTPESTQGYGIAVDGLGRTFIARRDGGLLRYTPDAFDVMEGIGEWEVLQFDWSSATRGVTVTAGGRVFLSHPNSDAVTMHDANSLQIIEIFNIGHRDIGRPWGLSPGHDGLILIANSGTPNLSVLDPSEGLLETIATQDNNTTYGDFTGYSLQTFVLRTGSLYRTYGPLRSCDMGVRSERSRLFYRIAFTGEGQVIFYGRSADTREGLDAAHEVLLGETSVSRGFVDIAEPMEEAGESSTRDWFQLRMRIDIGLESPAIRELILEEHCLP